MVKNKYISLILFLILIITVINLYYKPWSYDTKSKLLDIVGLGSSVSSSVCPLYGVKCPTDEYCDCEKMCSNGEFVPFHVLANESIYLMDRKLTPGTYCLPKGIGSCNQKTSFHVFSLTGWKCIPRNASLYDGDTLMACVNEDAADNSQNILWDFLKDEPAHDVENMYEKIGNDYRYRCKCNSLDIYGNRLLPTLPFTCSVDYCIKDIYKPLPNMGYKNGHCECMVYPHADPKDPTSPCVAELQRVDNSVDGPTLIGRVDCKPKEFTQNSLLYCPEGVTRFTTGAFDSADPINYLEACGL